MIEAKVIKDSWNGKRRLTTVVAKYHRFILPEVNTHRVFSRNTASSRAIPTAKLLEQIKEDPAIPTFFGANQPGMSASNEINDVDDAKSDWHKWAIATANTAKFLTTEYNLHKQTINRLIEPFLWTTQIITSTEWDNFFQLRRPPSGKFDPTFPAQPEMQVLACEIYNAMQASDPIFLKPGEWHVPFLTEEDRSLDLRQQLSVSSARCARVSYLTHDGMRDVQKDLSLAERLASDKHMSPFEHQARAEEGDSFYANFRGWRQFRWFVERFNKEAHEAVLKEMLDGNT